MNRRLAVSRVRACLAAVQPGIRLDELDDDTPLLAERVISSLDVLNLILHLEEASGRKVSREQLVPGSFRDVRTIARVFLMSGDSE